MKKTLVLSVGSILFLIGCSNYLPTAEEVSTVATVGGCPDGVTVSAAGNVYITDICSGEVDKIGTTGEKTIIVPAGEIDNADGITTYTTVEGKEILYVTETGTDPVTGEIVSSDGSIKKIDVDTGVVTEFVAPGVISNPTGIAADSLGNLYVADQAGSIYEVPVDENGDAETPVSLTANPPADINIEAPHGLALVENTGGSVTLYVTDQGATSNNIVKVDVPTPAAVDPAVNVVITEVTPATPASVDSDKFDKPHGVTVDSNGAIFVADENNNRVQVITPSGNVITFAGSTEGTEGDVNGSPAVAKLDSPRGLAVDATGDVLVCDYANAKVKKIKTNK